MEYKNLPVVLCDNKLYYLEIYAFPSGEKYQGRDCPKKLKGKKFYTLRNIFNKHDFRYALHDEYEFLIYSLID